MHPKSYVREVISVSIAAPAVVLAAPAVVLAALAMVFATPCLHAQALPSMQPTSLPVNNAMPAPINGAAMPGTLASNSPHRAHVTFAAGEVDVRADDSSLNQILRAISHATGLKITGGVADQRVFGNYGPAPLSTVLATLLDGTGTNILFMAGDADNAPRLMLTPRGGGATPPSPESPVYAAYDEPTPIAPQPVRINVATPSTAAPATATSGPAGPVSIAQPLNNVNGSPSNTSPTASTLPTTHSVPLDSIPTPSTTPSTSGIVDAPNPPPATSTAGSAPAGTLTPEMVYQELLKRQQQKQSANPSNNTKPQP